MDETARMPQAVIPEGRATRVITRASNEPSCAAASQQHDAMESLPGPPLADDPTRPVWTRAQFAHFWRNHYPDD